MSFNYKNFDWDIKMSPENVGVPVGYEFGFNDGFEESFSNYSLSTFRENAVSGSFFYSFDGDSFYDFPLNDEGFPFYTDYKMRLTIRQPVSGSVFLLSSESISKIKADCSDSVFDYQSSTPFSLISIDKSSNDIYTYYDGRIFCFSTINEISFKKSLDIQHSTFGLEVDGGRNVIWQICESKVYKRNLTNGECIQEYSFSPSIEGDVETFLNENNGDLVFSAQTGSGFEIFKIEYYSGSFTSDSSSNKISSICLDGSNYLVSFENQYLGSFSSGILNETYINTGRASVSKVSSIESDFYLFDSGPKELVKFTMPYSEDWSVFTREELISIRARLSDYSIITLSNNYLSCFSENGEKLGGFTYSNSNGIVLSGSDVPSYTSFKYRATYGEGQLNQSSSSSSSSSTSSSSSSSDN